MEVDLYPYKTYQLPPVKFSNHWYPLNTSLEEEVCRLFDNFAIDQNSSPPQSGAEEIREEFRKNGQDSEYCPDSDVQNIPGTKKRNKNKKPVPTECVFCRNNGEQESFYKMHVLKSVDGITLCPILRKYECPICGAIGDTAHTLKYCPKNKNPENIATPNALKNLKNSVGKRQTKYKILNSIKIVRNQPMRVPILSNTHHDSYHNTKIIRADPHRNEHQKFGQSKIYNFQNYSNSCGKCADPPSPFPGLALQIS